MTAASSFTIADRPVAAFGRPAVRPTRNPTAGVTLIEMIIALALVALISMAGLAVIGLKVMLPGGVSAKMAVLGPMRMNYERVISAVHQVGEAASSTLQS